MARSSGSFLGSVGLGRGGRGNLLGGLFGFARQLGLMFATAASDNADVIARSIVSHRIAPKITRLGSSLGSPIHPLGYGPVRPPRAAGVFYRPARIKATDSLNRLRRAEPICLLVRNKLRLIRSLRSGIGAPNHVESLAP
jgi:hypothetical protein